MAPSSDGKRKQRSDFMRCLYAMTYGSERGLVYIAEIAEVMHVDDMEAEIVARYLAEKGLIIIRLQRIVSLTQLGIDEAESILEQPYQGLHVAVAPDVKPPAVIPRPPSMSEAEGRKPPRPMPARIVPNDSDERAALELKQICAAIGLDPKEITGELGELHTFPGMETCGPEVNRSDPRNDLVQHDDGTRLDLPSQALPSFDEKELDSILASLKLQVPKLGLGWDDMAEARAEIDTARAQLSSPRPKAKIVVTCLESLLSILENSCAAASASNVRANLPALRDFCERLRA
ncbi:MAG: hypothetical protein WBQ79_20580 [Acidobacteriaceae bacterium]